MFDGHHQGPTPLSIGAVIGGTIILLLFLRTCTQPNEEALRSRFAAAEATTVANQADGILPVPEAVQEWGGTAVSKLRGGDAIVPVTPEIQSTTLNVDIQSLQQVAGGLQIKGTVTNIGSNDIRVPLAAFQFIDQTGTIYAAQSDAAAVLPPGTNTTLDLTLPIEDPTQLTMQVSIPEADVSLEMELLVSGSN